MKIIFSETCLEYSQPGHPESPRRVKTTIEHLRQYYDVVRPEPANEDDILLVHSQGLVDRVLTGSFHDGDSPAYPNLATYAKLSAGSAVLASKLAMAGTACMSLMRPPGHHAGKDFLGGFCYFNNIAIAVAKVLEELDKVAIIDFDCHHGNGTQDIFLGDERVLYVSLHQSPLYPGTGQRSESNCRNFPVEAFTDGDTYMKIFADAIAEVADFSPDLIAISAGFDTFKEDPITSLGLEIETFEKIGEVVGSLNVRLFSVLEGGYSTGMPQCVRAYLKGLEGWMTAEEKSGTEESRHYEFIEHTADIAIKAYGDKLVEAFAVAAEAMFDIVTDGSVVSPNEKVEIEIESVDREGLLVGFLSRLIVLHEVDGWVLTNFEVTLHGQNRLRASGWGEKFDKSRHSYGHHVKGVSYHMMEISEATGEEPAHVQVLFDV